MNILWKIFGIGGYDKFMEAISEGNLINVMKYYRKQYLEKENERGLKPIQVACITDNIDVIKFLIENRCDLESCDSSGNPPLHCAYKRADIDVVRFLVQNKYGMESCDAFGMRPIHWACLNGEKELLKLLIAYGCQLDCKTHIGETSLDIANQYQMPDCASIIKVAMELMPLIREITRKEIEAALDYYKKSNQLDKKICNVCLDMEVNCVLNCGHPFCMTCGVQFNECPICRSQPTCPKRLFLD